jgi:GNAT superfamily N-acetyltransferase
MKLQIESATPYDLQDILRLQKECYRSEAEIYDDFEIAPMIQDLASLETDLKSWTILKGTVNGQLAASVRGTQVGTTCFIGRLIVGKEWQNRGFGKMMLQAIESQFSGCERYELFTGHKIVKNLYLYRKQGYHEFKQEKISENLTCVFLEKITTVHKKSAWFTLQKSNCL